VQLINAEQYSQLSTGAALVNSTSLTDISPGGNTSGQALAIPANSLYQGLQFNVKAHGIVSTTGPPNLTLGVYYGGVAGTALATATVAASANMSNATWEVDADIRVDATGSSGTLRTQGKIIGVTSGGIAVFPATTATGGSATVATGVTNILTLGAQWGTGSPSNSITCYQFLVTQLD
jgi:hypothetical protein